MAEIRQTISTPKFGDLTFRYNPDRDKDYTVIKPGVYNKFDGQITSLDFSIGGKQYTFIPQNLIEKGWVDDGKQKYFANLLVGDNFKLLSNEGQYIDLAGVSNYDQKFKDYGISTTGFLLPKKVSFGYQLTQNVRSYSPNELSYNGEITGLGFINDKPVYLTAPKGNYGGGKVVQSWIQPPGTTSYTGRSQETGEFWAQNLIKGKSPLGAFGDFINDIVSSDLFKIGSLALGAYGLANLAAAPAAAAGGGLSASAGGITGLTPGAAGITGITAPAGFTLAPSVGAGLVGAAGASEVLGTPSYGLLDTAQFPTEGIKATPATTGGASAPFATTPAYSELTTVVPAGGGAATVPGLSVPGLSSMGGGTGLTVPVTGGTVTEMGFVPTGATPSLGDPASFINNPDYLGSPVISEDYLALTGADMPGGISIKDALDAARLGSQLLSPQQQIQGGLLGSGGGVSQPAGVDFSPLYGRTMVGLLPLAEQYRRSLL